MKSSWIAATMLAVAWMSDDASAQGKLSANFAAHGGGAASVVELTVVNVGDTALDLREAVVPKLEGSGRLMADLFEVLDAAGNAAPYRGILVENYLDQDSYVTIEPGEEKSYVVDIAKSYRLVPGVAYSVELRFPMRYLNRPLKQYKSTDREQLRDAEQKEALDPVMIVAPASQASRTDATVAATFDACTGDQQLDFPISAHFQRSRSR